MFAFFEVDFAVVFTKAFIHCFNASNMPSYQSKWIDHELPALVREGVIDGVTAERIRAHYAKTSGAGRNWALTVFGLLGGLLVGLGIILLLAHNWDDFPRPVRTVLAYLPLIAAQAIAVRMLFVMPAISNRTEGAAVFWTLSIAAVIAMVAQIYHMPGDAGAFVLTWMLLTLPVLYLMPSVTPVLIYLAGIVFWLLDAIQLLHFPSEKHFFFWLLWLAVLPLIISNFRQNRSSGRTAILMWGYLAAFGYGLATLADVLTWWEILFAVIFAGFYLLDKWSGDQTASVWRRPAYLIGVIGSLALAFKFSFGEDLAPRALPAGFLGEASLVLIMQYFIAGLFLLIYTLLLGRSIKSGARNDLWIGLLPFLVMAGVATSYYFDQSGLINLLVFNLYLFAIGLVKLIQGYRHQLVGKLNAGLLVLCGLIAVRFFDEDLGFVLRGVVFVLLGTAFLVANLKLARRRKGAA